MEKSKYQSIARKYLVRVARSGIPIEAAFVFGSQVKGEAHRWSDIDICVVSPIFGKDRQSERVRLMNLRTDGDLEIEPHPYSPEDFANRYDLLAEQVRRTGVRIR